jgi:hypothetical protein
VVELHIVLLDVMVMVMVMVLVMVMVMVLVMVMVMVLVMVIVIVMVMVMVMVLVRGSVVHRSMVRRSVVRGSVERGPVVVAGSCVGRSWRMGGGRPPRKEGGQWPEVDAAGRVVRCLLGVLPDLAWRG